MELIIDIKIIILVFFLILSGRGEIYLTFFAFTAIHELGHLLCGIFCRLKPKCIKIMPLGFSVTFQKNNIPLWREILICLAGPLTNFLIACISIYTIKLDYIVYTNILIGIFNLLPILPLDGGRIVKVLLRKKYSFDKSYKYTITISNITLALLVCVGIIIAVIIKNVLLIISIFLVISLTIIENRKMKIEYQMKHILKQNMLTKI